MLLSFHFSQCPSVTTATLNRYNSISATHTTYVCKKQTNNGVDGKYGGSTAIWKYMKTSMPQVINAAMLQLVYNAQMLQLCPKVHTITESGQN